MGKGVIINTALYQATAPILDLIFDPDRLHGRQSDHHSASALALSRWQAH